MFRGIKLNKWRQFDNINISLDRKLTILTGENGTGKTTILNLLSRHFGWNIQFISTLLTSSKRREKQMWSDVWNTYLSDFDVQEGSNQVGSIKYRGGIECQLMVQAQNTAQYQPKYQNQQNILGLHIPAHQPAFIYHQISEIPTNPKPSQDHFQAYFSLLQQYSQPSHGENPGKALKQSLISLAVFGYGNQVVAENPEYRRIFEQFQKILRIMLPKVLGFQRLEIRMPDIFLITDTGNFPLDTASGGIGAIIGIAWQIFMYGHNKRDFVVTIDEPESHLHPSMQRELLPNLRKAFPSAQFIIATHSPFIATSSLNARVYALIFNKQHHVNSLYLKSAELSGTANQTLRDILGVPITFPVWIEDRLRNVLENFKDRELTEELLSELKEQLITNKLNFLLPDAIKSLGSKDA